MSDVHTPAYIDIGTFVTTLVKEMGDIKKDLTDLKVIAAKTEVVLEDVANISGQLKREIYGNGNEGMKTKVEIHDRMAGIVNKLLIAVFGQFAALGALAWSVWRAM